MKGVDYAENFQFGVLEIADTNASQEDVLHESPIGSNCCDHASTATTRTSLSDGHYRPHAGGSATVTQGVFAVRESGSP